MNVVSGCRRSWRAAPLGAVTFIAACGGGGGGGGSAAPPTPPPAPPPVVVAFNDTNVVPATAVVFNLLDALAVADDTPSVVANVFLFSRDQAYEIVCVDRLGSGARVPVTFLYNDNDHDNAPSPGDTARLQHGECGGVSRTIDVSLTAFEVASGHVSGTVKFENTTTGGMRIAGSFRITDEPSADRSTVHSVLTDITATRVTANDSSLIDQATFEETLTRSTYSLSFSGHVKDSLLGADFTYGVSNVLDGDFLKVPQHGELIMTTGTSRVRIAPATDPLLRPNFFEYQVDAGAGAGYGALQTARWAAVTDGFTFVWDPNASPEITSLTLTPAAPRVTDTIVASYAASDLDGDTLSYSTAWFVNNVEVGSGTQLPPGRFRKGDTVGFTVRVSDAKATVISNASVVVVNTPPSNAGIAFTSAVVRSIDDVYTNISVRDDDGDLLDTRYEWRKNGAVIAGEDTQALNHSFYRKGDVVTATVTFNDGEASVSAQASITISDTLAEMFIGDVPPIRFGQPVTFQMGGSDYDGDPLPGFVLEHGPAGMTINRNTGVVSWTPSGPMFEEETEVSFGVAFDEPGGAVTSTIVTLQDQGRQYPLFRMGLDAPRPQGFTAGDFDGDGVDEVLVVGRRGTLYELARKSGGGYRQAWSYPYSLESQPSFVAATAADVDADGKAEIFAAMTYVVLRLNGTDRRFNIESAGVGGRPGFVVRDLAIGDLDRDGHPELVILEALASDNSPTADAHITVWPLATMSPRALDDGPYGTSLALGNVDNDPGLEIVTGGGYVIDGTAVMQGATGPTAVQWRRTPNFGTQVEVGDVDGDGRDEIVAVEDHANVRVYDALAKTLSFSILNTDTDALLVADIGGTAAKEIVIGDGPLGGGEIKAYRRSAGTTTQLFHVPAGGPNVPAIAAGDFDGDGAKEIAWGATGPADLIVIAAANGTVEWSSAAAPPQTVTGPFVGGQLARTPTNPRAPLFASVKTGTEGLRMISMNPTSGDLTYSAAFPRPVTDDTTLHVVDYDNDLRDEALVTTEQSTGAYQMAYDFYGGTTEWTSAIIAGETGAVASAYGDLTGDGRADLVAVNAFGVIRAYDVFKGTLLFEKTIPELFDAVAVAIANVNGTGAPEIVVAGAARVAVLSRDGASAYGVTRLSQPEYIDVRDLLVTDIDGDGAPEIFVLYGTPGSKVQRLDGNLVSHGGFSVEWPTSSTVTVEASSFARKNLVLHDLGDTPSVVVVDPDTGLEIWHSPRLLGEIAPDGIHFVDVAGDGRLRMTVATKLGMFITR